MSIDRRSLLVLGGTATLSALVPGFAFSDAKKSMYGLIGKILAVPGKRDELAAILVEGASGMPGCLSYVVSRDNNDANALWITEVWDSRDSHRASLELPAVQDAITRGKPLIAEFSEHFETEPIGGHGLTTHDASA